MAESRVVTADELDRAVEQSVRAVVRLLDAVDDPEALTPGGEWTVRETAAHVLAGTRMYQGLLAGRPSPLTSRDAYAPFNAGIFLGQPCAELAQLGRLVAAAAADYRDTAGGVGPDQHRPWHYGRSLPVAMHTGFVVNEHLMHGTDIARAAGVAWADEDGAAAVTWRTLGPWLTAGRFLGDIAGDLEATVSIGLAGEAPATFRIAEGAISRDDTAEPDCVITAPGMPLLRWFFQRDPWDAADLDLAGRRPELAGQLAELLRRI